MGLGLPISRMEEDGNLLPGADSAGGEVVRVRTRGDLGLVVIGPEHRVIIVLAGGHVGKGIHAVLPVDLTLRFPNRVEYGVGLLQNNRIAGEQLFTGAVGTGVPAVELQALRPLDHAVSVDVPDCDPFPDAANGGDRDPARGVSAVQVIIQIGTVLGKALVQGSNPPQHKAHAAGGRLLPLPQGRVIVPGLVEIPAQAVHGGALPQGNGQPGDPVVHGIEGAVCGQGSPTFPDSVPEIRVLIGCGQEAGEAGAAQLVGIPQVGSGEGNIVVRIGTAKGIVHVPNGTEKDFFRVRGFIRIEAGQARVKIHGELLQQIGRHKRIYVEVFAVVPALRVIACGGVEGLGAGVHPIGNVVDLGPGGILGGFNHHRLSDLGNEAAKLLVVSVRVIVFQQVCAGDIRGIRRDLDPLPGALHRAVGHRAVRSGSGPGQGFEIHVGIGFLVGLVQIGQINAILTQLHAFADDVVSQIVAVDVQIHIAVIAGVAQTHRLRVFPAEGVVQQGQVDVIGQQGPFLGLPHAEEVGFLVELDVVGLFAIRPGRVAPALDLLQGIVQAQDAVFVDANIAGLLVFLAGVNIFQAAGLRPQENSGQMGRLADHQRIRSVTADKLVGAGGKGRGACSGDQGLTVQQKGSGGGEIDHSGVRIRVRGQEQIILPVCGIPADRVDVVRFAAIGIDLQNYGIIPGLRSPNSLHRQQAADGDE